jgi:PGF-pre-PGF domain-containing protein
MFISTSLAGGSNTINTITTNLPTANVLFYISFNTIPSNSGLIIFNDIKYSSGNSNTFIQGNYPINVITNGNFIFSNWEINEANTIIFSNSLAQNTIVTINSNVVITAVFNNIITSVAHAINSTPPTSISTNTSTFTQSTNINSTSTIGVNIKKIDAVSISNISNSSSYNILDQINSSLSRLSSNNRVKKLNIKSPQNYFEIINFSSNFIQQANIPSNISNLFNSIKNINIANILIIYRNQSLSNNNIYNVKLFSNFSNGKIVAYASFVPPNVSTPILLNPNATLSQITVKTNKTINSILTNVLLSNILSNKKQFDKPFYTVIQINSTLSDVNVQSAIYNFSVSKMWINNQNISPDQITLYKYINNSWAALPTYMIGYNSNSSAYLYSAVSNSLSTYLVSFSTNGIAGNANPESITLPSGYKLYICAAGANYTFATSGTAFTWNQDVGAPPGAPINNGINASIGHQISNNICTAYTTGATRNGLAIAGIGLNQTRYNLYKNAVGKSTRASLSYTVITLNSFVVLAGAAGYYNLTKIALPAGCSMQVRKDNSDKYETAFIATCQSVASGSYTLSVSVSSSGSVALAAYVFPPYNIILDDNPTTATITTNLITYSNGQVMYVIGTNSITANPPGTGNWVFNSWSVSNTINLTLSSHTSNPATLTVMGNGIVTATWNGITKFFETGLPSGATWNVIYNGILNSSTTNEILFSNLPGTYSFNIPMRNINGIVYEPSPNSGSLYSGNAVTIKFKPFSVVISPPSNTIVDVGEYETFTATVYNGIAPYTYNLLVVNSITPSTIIHNDLVSGSTSNTLAYTFQTIGADVSNSPEVANVIVSDSFPATVNSVYSSTFKINPAMTTPSISPTAAANYLIGQTVNFSTSFTGGTSPYTYNWLVVNSITGALIANALYTGVSTTSNTFAWDIPSADVGNTVVANVIVTDSASTPISVNSVNSGVITIEQANCAISLSTNSINFGALNSSSSIATTNVITDSNSGSVNANILVYGGNWLVESTGANGFGVSNTSYSSTYNVAYSNANKLSSTATDTLIVVPASGSNTIYFGLRIPSGTPPMPYTQTITIENSC